MIPAVFVDLTEKYDTIIKKFQPFSVFVSIWVKAFR